MCLEGFSGIQSTLYHNLLPPRPNCSSFSKLRKIYQINYQYSSYIVTRNPFILETRREIVGLYRPVGIKELALIQGSDYAGFITKFLKTISIPSGSKLLAAQPPRNYGKNITAGDLSSS